MLAAGYIAPFLERANVFNGIGFSERPDTVCGKINEGRIAILVDGTPNVLIIPFLFVENFQSVDDYITRPIYATMIRWLKYPFLLFSYFPAGAVCGQRHVPPGIFAPAAAAQDC